jgi:hypothetical protein
VGAGVVAGVVAGVGAAAAAVAAGCCTRTRSAAQSCIARRFGGTTAAGAGPADYRQRTGAPCTSRQLCEPPTCIIAALWPPQCCCRPAMQACHPALRPTTRPRPCCLNNNRREPSALPQHTWMSPNGSGSRFGWCCCLVRPLHKSLANRAQLSIFQSTPKRTQCGPPVFQAALCHALPCSDAALHEAGLHFDS